MEATNRPETRPPTERHKFESFDDELRYNIARAEWYARQAHDLCYKRGRDNQRGFWFRVALGRAQSTLMSLYQKELKRDHQ